MNRIFFNDIPEYELGDNKRIDSVFTDALNPRWFDSYLCRLTEIYKKGSNQDSVGKASLPAIRKIIVRKYSKVLKP